MAGSCCGGSCGTKPPRNYRQVLWLALIVNTSMFLIEIGASIEADSAALRADALDFLADAANYAISLMVLGLAIGWRARAAIFKGLSLAAMGLWALATSVSNALAGTVPDHDLMGGIGFLALAANLLVAAMLFAGRRGDANMRSVWLCSRNDALANIAVIMAALGVWSTDTGWPDVVVATGIASLGLTTAWSIIRQALAEMRKHETALAAE
ncbi:MAG TPA: cation transporter [Azospirillaceae bacterium]|nr:cation transporter [Azospirillaceae bacterium]